MERTYIIGSPEEGQEEAQGPEAVGDLGISILSVMLARRRRRRRGGTLALFLQRRTGSRPRRKPCRAQTGRLLVSYRPLSPRIFLTFAVHPSCALDNLHSAFRAERGAGFSVRASP